MELLFPLAFEILAFNTLVTCGADAAIQLVIVSFAVRSIPNDVECGSLERLETCGANKALFVIAASQPSVS